MSIVARVRFASGGSVCVDPAALVDKDPLYPPKEYPGVTVEHVRNACGYNVSGGTGPWRCGNQRPCPEHEPLRCACGRPAVMGCIYSARHFVCGQPVCAAHERCVAHYGRRYR